MLSPEVLHPSNLFLGHSKLESGVLFGDYIYVVKQFQSVNRPKSASPGSEPLFVCNLGLFTPFFFTPHALFDIFIFIYFQISIFILFRFVYFIYLCLFILHKFIHFCDFCNSSADVSSLFLFVFTAVWGGWLFRRFIFLIRTVSCDGWQIAEQQCTLQNKLTYSSPSSVLTNFSTSMQNLQVSLVLLMEEFFLGWKEEGEWTGITRMCEIFFHPFSISNNLPYFCWLRLKLVCFSGPLETICCCSCWNCVCVCVFKPK